MELLFQDSVLFDEVFEDLLLLVLPAARRHPEAVDQHDRIVRAL